MRVRDQGRHVAARTARVPRLGPEGGAMTPDERTIPGAVLLSGVVGSTAYGLDRPGSDIDRLGIFGAPTHDLLGLTHPKDSYRQSPDAIYHEARKAAMLLLKANPSITEILWLDDYETVHPLGSALIGLRDFFLSSTCVRGAYFGYALDQFTRLKNRCDGTFSSDTRLRTAKHARHLYRLLHQGGELHLTGSLQVRLRPEVAARCQEFGDRVVDDIELARRALDSSEIVFEMPTPLPAEPNTHAAEAWLLSVRREFYDQERPRSSR